MRNSFHIYSSALKTIALCFTNYYRRVIKKLMFVIKIANVTIFAHKVTKFYTINKHLEIKCKMKLKKSEKFRNF